MKFALCDDDPNDLQQIRDYLLHYDAQEDWKSFTSSKELLASFQCDYFDIVLLDIEMDGINGYQAAEKLNKLPDIPLIIFITQSGAYTIRGYEVAFRYLKKPVEYSDFVWAVSAAVAKCSPKSISVAGERGPILVRIRDITYIEVFNYTTIIHTIKGQHQVRTPLKGFEANFRSNGFARPHNSFLVNLDFVDHIQKSSLFLTDGTDIPISRNRKKAFDEALFRFLRR